MELTFASYNIHKGVGADRKSDPERIMAVIHELNADVVALQEADRRFGRREAVLPRAMLEEHHWQVVPVRTRPESMGWHGNAILVRQGIEVLDAEPIALPALEPRGAICTRLKAEDREFCVAGMHLDLSGLLRRNQIEAVCKVMSDKGAAVLLGDFNEWSARGSLRGFAQNWNVLQPGRSFPSRRPIATLDRIVTSPHWVCSAAAVHHSALATLASDHLPVSATLSWRA